METRLHRFLLSCHRRFGLHHYTPIVCPTFEYNFNTLCCICQRARSVLCNPTSKLALMDDAGSSLRDFKENISIKRPVWNAYLQYCILRNIFCAAMICKNAKFGAITFVNDDIENTDAWEQIRGIVPEADIKGRGKKLHPTDTKGCIYLSLPLILTFGIILHKWRS